MNIETAPATNKPSCFFKPLSKAAAMLCFASFTAAPLALAAEPDRSDVTSAESGAESSDDIPSVLFETDSAPQSFEQALIDTEDFEIGAFAGVMSVEDFGTNFVWGARVVYHLSEDLFLEANYGETKTDETSFERLSGGAKLLSDSDRDLTYYNVSIGFNLLPGQAFVGSAYVFNTNFYLVGGLGSTDFAGDNNLTANVGFGYQVLATDWLSFQLVMRDHIFNNDILGEDKTNHNLEFTSGLSIFF